jgi:hypothetical protein
MFAMFHPHQAGCELAAADVMTFTATVTPSTDGTHGKYPEYHRVWQDGALQAVILFSHEYDTPTTYVDEGAPAYDAFVWRMHQYLAQVQPDATKVTEPAGLTSSPSAAGLTTVRLAAELPDGRTMALDVRLVGTQLVNEKPEFDDWYNALTPAADVILYNGHAGLGSNVRTLMEKGAFRSGQYLVWFANGCDTLAYVDPTLTQRRAELNPDDPAGTKYTDTVTNVMAGYFTSLEKTAVTFLRAFVEVRYPEIGPKTYEQIFQSIDPTQVAVVTGEEDNELQPLPPSLHPPGAPPADDGQGDTQSLTNDASDGGAAVPPTVSTTPSSGDHHGCDVSAVGGSNAEFKSIGLIFAALVVRRRRRGCLRRSG